MSPRALLLPGGVLPAELACGALLAALDPDVEAVAKDLEVYAADEPPVGYTLDHEIEGVLREADARGWGRFHLVGYSGGGAAALAFAARHPDRLGSLALIEPAWAGSWDRSPAELAVSQAYEALLDLPPEEFMDGFFRVGTSVSGPSAPPEGEPPPWMAKRPGGLRALMLTFRSYDLERDALRRFAQPVYFALGGLSNPDEYAELAKRLGRVFPDFELEVFEERHHFDPPHRAEPERLARSLGALWSRAETY
jgi:pimeloyl-ACP methyl ester carboxylesterase